MAEELLALITASTSKGDFESLGAVITDALRQQPKEVFAQLLTRLDPHHHTCALTHTLLSARAQNSIEEDEWLSTVISLFHNANPRQVQATLSDVTQLALEFSRILLEKRMERRGVMPLKALLLSMCDDPTTLTAVHTEFAKLCLRAKLHSVALDIIDHSICTIIDHGCSAETVLCYLYYRGRIFCALKEFKKALASFNLCFVYPSDTPSAVAGEAYKHALMTHIILNGATPFKLLKGRSIRIVPQSVMSLYSPLCTASTPESLESTVEAANQDMTAANLTGLWKQALKARKMHKIKALTKVFVTLSLEKVAEKVGLDSREEAFNLIFDMITSGLVNAKIDAQRGIVHFLSKSASSKPMDLEALETELKSIAKHYSQLRRANEALEVSVDYQTSLLRPDRTMDAEMMDL